MKKRVEAGTDVAMVGAQAAIVEKKKSAHPKMWDGERGWET